MKTKARHIDGILILDKPLGLTSNAALQKAKEIFQARKAGHTGSLDPLASGMLPLCFGEATKFSQFLLDADKVYLVKAKLGKATETGDAEGKVVKTMPVPKLTKATIEKVLHDFTGEISQIPSMYSAIKYNGQPLYELARRGITVERESRKVKIFSIDLLDYEEDAFTYKVHCSKGTYVRTLTEDIGLALNCVAYVSFLRRLSVAHFSESQMIEIGTLEKLAEKNELAELDKLLMPIEAIFSGWPKINISEEIAYYLKQGQAVIIPRAPSSGLVMLQDKNGSFLGVGEIIADGRVAPRRLTKS